MWQPASMAATHSFDVTCGCDLQEVDNAVNQAHKELSQRFDFKNLEFKMVFKRADNIVELEAPDRHKLAAIWEVMRAKLIRRQVPVKNFKLGDIVAGGGGKSRQTLTLSQGIDADAARKLVKYVKEARLKRVQAAVQSDQVRISGPSLDDLQAAIARLREHDFGIELNFGNFR